MHQIDIQEHGVLMNDHFVRISIRKSKKDQILNILAASPYFKIELND
jgi:hypothetical protein